MRQKQMLAADFGASSGRVMMGNYDGSRIEIQQMHRFLNEPVYLSGTLYWDFLRLFHELKIGIGKASKQGKPESIGVDTWGVDFGFLDKDGFLMENPVNYRDKRTEGMLKEAEKYLSFDRFYEITGNQFMEINTAFQLLSLKKMRPEMLERADRLLLLPDLFNYYLSGTAVSEYTIASTTQLMDAAAKKWSQEVLDCLQIPSRLFASIVEPGTCLGKMKTDVCTELGTNPLEIVAVAGHDTQCALAAVPAESEDFIFVSCGTWSLFGTELDAPVINELSTRYNVTNEGAFGGKISFLKNIIGLWLVQESRRQWIREGAEYDFGTLEKMASLEPGRKSFIDPDHPDFAAPGNVPERIRDFCKKSGQAVPDTPAQIVRCINESLALKYRMALEEICACTGKKYKAIHMVGGGTQSGLLCQLVANVCRLPVYAGPVEATVYGNLGIQLLAAGEVSSLSQLRQLIRASEEIQVYEPKTDEAWEEIYQEFKEKIVK